jgi:hypothetical protein|tara:strand:- start:62 stop:250 length:189 start_codon:yes stop_codon:yes gene_type:complete
MELLKMSNEHNEELMLKLIDEAYDELIANGMSIDAAAWAATDLAKQRYNDYADGYTGQEQEE